MKKQVILVFLFVMLFSGITKAQNVATLYFMDEIAERNNMNPALLPNCGFYFDFIVLPNFNIGVGTNNFALTDILYNKKGQTQTFLNDRKSKNWFYAKLHSTSQLSASAQFNILSFGFRVKEKHYITFDMGLNMDIQMYMPKDLFKLALYGTPDLDGVNRYNLKKLGLDASLYSNVSLGYMNKINDQWTVGVKAKFLMGYANVFTDVKDLHLDASRQNWTLTSQAKLHISAPVTMKYNDDGRIDGVEFPDDYNRYLELLYKPAGYGAAFDLGFTYKPIKDLTLSAAITDLGFIRWHRNVYYGAANESVVYEGVIDSNIEEVTADGFETKDLFNGIKELGNEALNALDAKANDEAYFSMPYSTFSAAVEYGVLKNKISFGLLNRLRFNTRHLSDEVTLAVNFRPLDWLKTSVSYSFVNGRWGNLGLGLNLRVGMFNMYLIADYIPICWSKVSNLDKIVSDAPNNLTLPYRTQYANLQVGWTWNLFRDSSDKDHDGVVNWKDKCKDSDLDYMRSLCPELVDKKDIVDKHGCYYDEDKDGVYDCLDQCPGTPEGVEVDEKGCPVDKDNDGVADYLDKCPGTPEGVEVDENGCPIDSDNDGVADYLDECPDTPAGVEVDEKGCPVDNDNDGVADYLDKCPDTPAGVEVDADGCPVDTDNDGIADYLDKCADTPAGVEVDEEGCPKDSDGDGIADYLDKCPDVAGVPENFGCPPVPPEVTKVFRRAVRGIKFAIGKSLILPSSYPSLDQMVVALYNNPHYSLIIHGHTDITGSDELNRKLSQDRADAVRKYLIKKGIAEERITAIGHGSDNPLDDNTTSAGRTQNRRVDYELIYEGVSPEEEVDVE